VIAGQPPRVGAEITGCRFAERCPAAIDACRSAAISLARLAPGHQVRCVRADDPELAGVIEAEMAAR
jgi:oligopeptide/dipeptide ABC transporter ATP-binding protein